jgi:hypothetical protein
VVLVVLDHTLELHQAVLVVAVVAMLTLTVHKMVVVLLEQQAKVTMAHLDNLLELQMFMAEEVVVPVVQVQVQLAALE